MYNHIDEFFSKDLGNQAEGEASDDEGDAKKEGLKKEAV